LPDAFVLLQRLLANDVAQLTVLGKALFKLHAEIRRAASSMTSPSIFPGWERRRPRWPPQPQCDGVTSVCDSADHLGGNDAMRMRAGRRMVA